MRWVPPTLLNFSPIFERNSMSASELISTVKKPSTNTKTTLLFAGFLLSVGMVGCVTKKPPVIKPPYLDFSTADCKPAYPRAALRHEQTGAVVYTMLVEADGAISNIEILKSSGFPLLDNAVPDRIRTGICKAAPGTIDGQPHRATTKVQYIWKLD